MACSILTGLINENGSAATQSEAPVVGGFLR
jgi:hypothetical protein